MSMLDPREPDDLHHLAAAYALDALDADERRRYEAHYPRCDICAGEVAEFRETAADLGRGGPGRHRRPTSRTGSWTRWPAPRSRRPRSTRWPGGGRSSRLATALVASAAAIVAIALGGAALLRSPDQPDGIGDLLALPDTVVATLDGPDGTLRVLWSPSTDRVGLIGEGLDVPGPGETYALWFLLDDGVAPAGLFEPTEAGSVRQLLSVDDRRWGRFRGHHRTGRRLTATDDPRALPRPSSDPPAAAAATGRGWRHPPSAG